MTEKKRKDKEFVLWLEEIGKEDTPIVGGKSANLGEMINNVKVRIPPGFATTAYAYQYFIKYNKLDEKIREKLKDLDTRNLAQLKKVGKEVREMIRKAEMPEDLEKEIVRAYRKLGTRVSVVDPYVAVRSSATAEDLPGASFAGQQETYLNVKGEKELVEKIKECYASLFTDRAISYRVDKGFDHFRVALSAVVQKMARSDLASSGVMFTLDPDSGFRNVVTINGSYGLGEYIVQGIVTPDEWMVFKPTMKILEKKLGDKKVMLVRDEKKGGNKEVRVPEKKRREFCLTDEQVLELAEYGLRIEKHYGCPMDIEWALDGETNEIYIVQARPETVHSTRDQQVIRHYHLKEKGRLLLKGIAIGRKIGAGKVKILNSPSEIDKFKGGDVLVTTMTDPDWEPIMKMASAIITEEGGRTSHAAIVSRELGVPCVIGTGNAREVLKNVKEVTVDCSTGEGRVYEGILKYTIEEEHLDRVPKTHTKVLVNLGEPDQAFSVAQLPVEGVGLAREEFIIGSEIGVHPMKLVEEGKQEVFINALATGIGKMCAAFYPRPVIVRLSDFKSDEYRNLEGGEKYEPVEANPMIGWRGASRYYDPAYLPAFEMELEALRRVWEDMELKNLVIMIPFCRTVEEGRKVKEIMKKHGLSRDKGLKIFVMAEIPSNIWLAEEFAREFDGFSIGSNDLTQLTLGIDRNSERLSKVFDERNEAVKKSIAHLIRVAHEHDPPRKVGICGQAPSDYPEYAEFLVEHGIDTISVNPDVALETIKRVHEIEKKLGRSRRKRLARENKTVFEHIVDRLFSFLG